jgi:hypothetical protein
MATEIKVVLGYVDQQTIRSRGGRAATKASNIKLASADRLQALVRGEAVGRGVENTDPVKEGHLTPEIRMDILKARIEGYDARITRMATEIVVAAQEGATSKKLLGMDETRRALRARREKAVEEFISIMRDMGNEEQGA